MLDALIKDCSKSEKKLYQQKNAEVTIENTNTSGNIENNTITNNVNNNTANNIQDNINSNNNQKDDTIIGSILPKTGKELALKIIPATIILGIAFGVVIYIRKKEEK